MDRFIPNTVADDRGEIDAYVIGEFEPLEKFEGYIVSRIKCIIKSCYFTRATQIATVNSVIVASVNLQI